MILESRFSKIRILIVLMVLIFSFPGFGSGSFDIKENCDLPLGTLKSQKTSNAGECKNLCNATSGCVGFVFVSGWNNCQLKSKKQKPVSILMHGGKKEGLSFTDFGEGFDSIGKDLRRVENMKSLEKCKEQCAAEPSCAGYTWIKGYNDCWLKKNVSGKIPKRFICGIWCQSPDCPHPGGQSGD